MATNDIEFQLEDTELQEIVSTTNEESPSTEQPITTSENDFDYGGMYDFFKDSGIVEEIEDKTVIKSWQDLSQMIYKKQETEIQTGIEQRLSTMNDTYKDLFTYLDNGGNLQEFVKTYNDDYDKVDASQLKDNDVLQDKIIYDYYKFTTQWDDKMIRTMMGKLNDDEKIGMAKTSLHTLKQIQTQQKQELLNQQQVQVAKQTEQKTQLLSNYKQQIASLNKVGDLEMTVTDKKEIENLLFNDVTYNKLSNDFEKYRLQLVILDKFGLLDDINKLTNIIKQSPNKTYNVKRNNNESSKGIDDIQFEFLENKPTQNNNKPMFWF